MNNENKNLNEIEKAKADKKLLNLEIILFTVCIVILLACTVVASFLPMKEWQKITLILVSLIPLLVMSVFALKIEQKAGYYKCSKCNHYYVPTFKSMFLAPCAWRTRYMRCPNCKQKSWQKKVITKGE